jgi:hypothetical protein
MRTRSALALLLPLISAVSIAPVRPAAAAPDHGTAPARVLHRGDQRIPLRSGLRLNEVDYDQPGVDTGEFVEIVNAGATRHRLRRVALVLVNGTTSGEYRRVALSGRLGPSRRLVVATEAVSVDGAARTIAMPLARDNVQNGAPDAVVLVDVANDVLLDALSYEGAIDAATIDGMAGVVSLVEGRPVAEADGNETPASICRSPDGGETGDDDRDWASCSPTPGAANRRAGRARPGTVPA